LNNTRSISLAAGTAFDVSALSAFTLSGGTTFIASGNSSNTFLNGPAGGTVSLGSQPVTLNFDGYDPALVVPQGTLSLGDKLTRSIPPSLGQRRVQPHSSEFRNLVHAGAYKGRTATNGATGGACVRDQRGIAYVQL